MEKIHDNIFLIGLMGAGKTTLGKKLAQDLQCQFYDSDHVIMDRTGVSIPTIFELEGEEGFRNRESAVIDELTQEKPIILATGGGAVLRPENRRYLHERGVVFYLSASPDVLLARTRSDKSRPLLQVADPYVKLQELLEKRDALYRETAHFVIDAGEDGCHKTAEKILDILKKQQALCAN
ncbi:MAG: shikimate kinase [Neisseria sp.]|uniref:shikimate kinase n=1 Tax=Neisseria sp. TaxID=192066 RepID=UPI0026DB415A|nr:shikimate kinase [Neisseria sp.]MDO4249563.1 shikimate kinase [Neisseria sp.]